MKNARIYNTKPEASSVLSVLSANAVLVLGNASVAPTRRAIRRTSIYATNMHNCGESEMNMTISVDRSVCPNGHELTPENTYRSNFGQTLCLPCRREARQKKRGLDELLSPYLPRTEDWKIEGKCVGSDLDFMFPEQGMPATRQRAVCADCPVKAECFVTGMFESHGIWGGYTVPERVKMRRDWNRVPWDLVESLPRHEEAQSA